MGNEAAKPFVCELRSQGVPVLLAFDQESGAVSGTLSGVPRVSRSCDPELLTQSLYQTFVGALAREDGSPRETAPQESSASNTGRLPSERNALETEVKYLRAELAQTRDAVRARDNFIAVVAHELRNPMTPMIVQVQRLLTKVQKLEGAETSLLREIEFLDRAVDYYYRRATALLEISRVAAGHLRLEPTAMDLSTIVRNAVLRYAFLAERAGTRIDENIENGIAGILDQMAVEQITDNILSNAVRYGDGKPV